MDHYVINKMETHNPYAARINYDARSEFSSAQSVLTQEKLSNLDAIRQSRVNDQEREVVLLTPVVTDFTTTTRSYNP